MCNRPIHFYPQWAVGVLTYELLVGLPPFSDKQRAAVEDKIRQDMPRFPSKVCIKNLNPAGPRGFSSRVRQECSAHPATFMHHRNWRHRRAALLTHIANQPTNCRR